MSPWQLGVLSSTKGLLAGKMKIVMTENVVIDCSLHIDGILLPQCIADIERMTTDAKYVLLVEKDTVFKKLVKFNISEYFGTECILITVSFRAIDEICHIQNGLNLNSEFCILHTGQRLSGHQYTVDVEKNLGFA